MLVHFCQSDTSQSYLGRGTSIEKKIPPSYLSGIDCCRRAQLDGSQVTPGPGNPELCKKAEQAMGEHQPPVTISLQFRRSGSWPERLPWAPFMVACEPCRQAPLSRAALGHYICSLPWQ